MTITALNLKTKLANNPSQSPKYKQIIHLKNNSKIEVADPKATRALLLLMNQHATIGGAACHWGGPSAFAEIISATFGIMYQKSPWFEHYHFVNDAGHAENGIYAHHANWGVDQLTFEDLKKFRSIDSKLTGHGEAHLNPENVMISNGPLGSGLPQAQGLAMADKIINKKRTTICVLSDGAAMEGEAKEAMAAIPGLYSKNKINPFLLLISDNNTKLGGRIDEDSYSMAPTFNALSTLGFQVKYIEEGNHLPTVVEEIFNALSTLENSHHQPIALIFKTIKGIGLNATIQSKSGGHGYPFTSYDEKIIPALKEIYGNESVPFEFLDWASHLLASKPAPSNNSKSSPVTKKTQAGFAKAINQKIKEGYPIFSLTSDLPSSTGLKEVHLAYPTHYIDLGIAESNMISAAIGLSKVGLIPIVDTFAQFGVTKGNLPLMMAGLSEAPIIALFSHAGFQDAADGASHQATSYYAALSAIPHVSIIHVSSCEEAEHLMNLALTKFYEERQKGIVPNSIVFFLGRENYPESYLSKPDYQWNKGQIVREGSDALVVAAGPMLDVALAAQNELKNTHQLHITVVNHPFINRPDVELISKLLKSNKQNLLTIEDHQIIGGMGQMLTHALLRNGQTFRYTALGVNGEFGQSAYKASELYSKFHLSSHDVVKAILEMR